MHATSWPDGYPVKPFWRPALTALTFGALWWLLTDGTKGSWLIGIPAVLAASWSARSLELGDRWTISLWGLVRFFPFFLWESLRGGADVARRTLAPRMRIQPGFTVYRTGLQQPAARVFFANCVCLLPGTLAADQRGDQLDVHMLDAGLDPQADLHRLEHAVAAIYREAHQTKRNPVR